MPSPILAADRLWRNRSDGAGIIREIGDVGQGSIDIVLDFPPCCNRIAGLQSADDRRPRSALTPPRHHQKCKTNQNAAKTIEKRAEQAHELPPGHDATMIRASRVIVAENRAAAYPFRPQIKPKCCAERHEYEQHQSLD
jgi:hypothetical protein